MLTGILVEFGDGTVTMAATDSYRLSVKTAPLPGAAGTAQAIVPARALSEVTRIGAALAGEGLEVAIERKPGADRHGRRLALGAAASTGSSRTTAGCGPSEFNHEVSISKDELLDVIRRTALMAQRNAPLRLTFAEGSLTLAAQSQDVGEARESLPVDFHGETTGDRLQPGLPARRRGQRRGRERAPAADQLAAPGPDPGRRRRLLVPDHADQAPLLAAPVRAGCRPWHQLPLLLAPGARARAPAWWPPSAPTARARRRWWR